jgi:two-component system sensor histidine kinase KdpD
MPHQPDRNRDAEALLQRVAAQEARQGRGRLRIYFGASAGVGKTYAMLLDAKRLVEEDGRDVVIGVVETHGRAKTAALAASFPGPILPPRMDLVQGSTQGEFDLDAALKRRPEVIVVDELAHTNLAGSRHPKRWQDVEELLASGIDVMTALNVQHLESLRDVVQGITGIHVAETLPDTFFDSATEVVLVDLPSEDLLERLRSGQVYAREQAERASKNFFRTGNLSALRELALRRTAERVESEVQSYRVERSISPVWKTKSSLLCCIGPAPSDQVIVRGAARLAAELDATWHAIYVETPALSRLPEAQRAQILGVVQLASSLGAKTTILASSKVADAVIEYARRHNHARVVLGRSARIYLPWRESVVGQLARLAPDIDLIELAVDKDATRKTAPNFESAPPLPERVSAHRRSYVLAVGASLLTTLLAAPLVPLLSLTNIAMLFLLTVALVAMRLGRGAAVLAAFLNVAAYDFFFVPPRYSFAVTDFEYIITFLVMLVVGLSIAELTSRLRYQARVSAHREGRSRSLYELARDLSAALKTEDVERIALLALRQGFRCEALILHQQDGERLDIPDAVMQRSDFEPAIATWSFTHKSRAGLGTDTLPRSDFLYLPLIGTTRVRGVVAVKPKMRRYLLVPEQLQQLDTVVALIAIALERVHYADVAKDALVSMESERLRNSLLAAVSHDLRTPLAAVVGLAETLDAIPSLPKEERRLASGIVEQARRMRALITNLLEMARIEAGEVRVNAQWQPLAELIGTTLSAWHLELTDRPVTVDLHPEHAMAFADAVLMDRILSNLIENTLQYTEAGTPIRIEARAEQGRTRIALEDCGVGIRNGDTEQIFAKFVRGNAESSVAGIGLGLTIARALARAQGGELNLDPSYNEGARFVIDLPQPELPASIREALELAADESIE